MQLLSAGRALLLVLVCATRAHLLRESKVRGIAQVLLIEGGTRRLPHAHIETAISARIIALIHFDAI